MIEPYFHQTQVNWINFWLNERVDYLKIIDDAHLFLYRKVNPETSKLLVFLHQVSKDQLDLETHHYKIFRDKIYGDIQFRRAAWELYKAAVATRLNEYRAFIQTTYTVPLENNFVGAEAIVQDPYVIQNAQILLLEQSIEEAVDTNQFADLAMAYPIPT